MKLQTIGWIAVLLQVLLLATWMYSVFISRNGTDAAGRGMALPYLLVLGIWILISLALMLLNRKWATIVVLIMVCIPLVIVMIGLIKKYR